MKASVIGLGRIGFEYSLDPKRVQPASHLGCYSGLLEWDNDLAFCDIDPVKLGKAERWAPLVPSYRDYHEMLGEFEPEIVSIATPTPTHCKITCDVASYSCVRTIFLEKPIAQSLKEADEIIQTCRKNRVRLAVNYTRRWSETYREVKQMIHADRIGNFISILGVYDGPLLRTGSHMLDLFNFLVDRPAIITVQSFGESQDNYLTLKTASNDYSLNGVVVYQDGTQAVLVAGKPKPYLVFEVDIFGSEGRMRVTGNGQKIKVYEKQFSDRYSKMFEVKPVLCRNKIDRKSILLRAVEQVVDNATVEKGANIQKGLACTGKTAKKALQLALGLHYSAMNKHCITVLKDVPKDYTVRSY